MEQKTVYQCDSHGRYLGPTVADESPLEPGVYLIPAGCVELAPPECDPGFIAVWKDAAWNIEPEPVAPPVEDKGAQQAAEEEKAKRLIEAAHRIAPLQDAIDLGMATEAETATLNAWKTYRVLLNRVPLQPGYPLQIDWPVAPA